MSRYRKLVAALVGAAAQAVNLGVVPQRWQPYVTIAVGFATAAGVYAAPNES